MKPPLTWEESEGDKDHQTSTSFLERVGIRLDGEDGEEEGVDTH